MGTALQVFFNLGNLRETILGVIDGYKASVQESVTNALEIKIFNQPANTKGYTFYACLYFIVGFVVLRRKKQ